MSKNVKKYEKFRFIFKLEVAPAPGFEPGTK